MTEVAEHETLQEVAEKHAEGKITEAEAAEKIAKIVSRVVKRESAITTVVRELFPSLQKSR